jgi:hypothetical protein
VLVPTVLPPLLARPTVPPVDEVADAEPVEDEAAAPEFEILEPVDAPDEAAEPVPVEDEDPPWISIDRHAGRHERTATESPT